MRSFIHDQRDIEGDVRLTFVRFDTQDPCEIVYDRTPLVDVKDEDIVLIPRGGTPLLDAVGKACAHLRAQRLFASKASLVGPVVAMVITDGEENSSTEWTREKVRSLKDELEKDNWTFLFLGADIDAFSEAASIGVSAGTVMSFTNTSSGSVAAAYAATSHNYATARNAHAAHGDVGAFSANMSYSSLQREAAAGPGADSTVQTVVENANQGTTTTTTTGE